MDAVLFQDLHDFAVLETYVAGRLVAEQGRCLAGAVPAEQPNCFHAEKISAIALAVAGAAGEMIRIIEARDGELVTGEGHEPPRLVEGTIEADPERDLLQLVVLNRYAAAEPACAFVRGFGLKSGAMASTVAHDSHNIIAVGASREEISRAINALVESGGGIAVCEGESIETLALPVAGLMSTEPAEVVAQSYAQLDHAAKALGSTLRAPFMTLSFMALLVIPALKLSDKGLFDGEHFSFVPLAL